MRTSVHNRLAELMDRHEEVGRLLADPDVLADPDRYRQLSQEFSRLEDVARVFDEYRQLQADLDGARQMVRDDDPEVRNLARDEVERATTRSEALEEELQRLLLPRDPHDDSSAFLEIRAGTGGDEAALFAGDLLRMYTRYAERQGWRVEILAESPGEHGGYREVIAHVVGTGVYGALKFESGAHRVQRVPQTESQGRIHTSACTVAVLPEVADVETVEIDPGELRVDTFRASGAGGQHVNKTDSAVRITHLPSGVVVECQEERSQHKNRARALSLLQAKLEAAERERRERERADTRRNLVGSGDRSERIRTYNFPQGRLTDHRINLTLYQLEAILEGNLEPVVDALANEHHADLLAEMTGESA